MDALTLFLQQLYQRAELKTESGSLVFPVPKQLKKKLSIGYSVNDKRFKDILDYMVQQGHNMTPIDLSLPIETQGQFDILLHKNTKDVANRSTCQVSQKKMTHLEEFCRKHPDCLVVDSPVAIEALVDRILMWKKLETMKVTDGVGTCYFPKSVLLEQGKPMNLEGFSFPAVAKPANADGSASSHEMALVYKAEGLEELFQTLGNQIVLQEFLNHDGVLHKIYVIGDEVYLGTRPSLANLPVEAPCNFEYFGRISQHPDSTVDPSVVAVPSLELVKMVCADIRKRMNLTLFGVDMITKTGTTDHFVIDVNYFPSYVGMENVPTKIEEWFLKTVRQRTKEKIRGA